MYKTEAKVLSDGTLHVTVDHDISTINRILLSQKGTHWGELYYSDALQSERKTCEGCKHEYDKPCSVRPFCARMHDDLYIARDNK